VIVSIAQPCYLGWRGYFDRIRQSDLHVVLDHVQLEKGGFTNRTRIMQRDGRVMWLTIPVDKGQPINETRVMNERWRKKHCRALEQAYGFSFPLPSDPGNLLEVLIRSSQAIARRLGGVWPSMTMSSYLGGSALGAKSDLVLNLCREVGATVYLSGPYGRDYLDLPSFDAAGIEVRWHDYPVEQPVLSAVHYLRDDSGVPSAVR
jgi:hypothetical protein